jgi:cytochrome c biogenesis protein CcdA
MTDLRAFATATLKKATVLVLDLFTSFVGFGYGVGYATNSITDDGIALSALGAGVTFALMGLYFLGSAWLGGTLWQRFLGTAPARTMADAPR